ncbi:ribonuclease H-like domain-containing protein [Tanacetum coccineum]
MSEPMPTIPTQSPFTYPIPNPSASPSFTQDDTSESFIPEPTQPMPTFTQTAFSQPAFSQPNQSIFSQPAVHFQQTQPTQTNQTGQQYPNNVQSQQFQQFQTATISANNAKFPYLEKEKYEIWAMKMEYWIQNADHNLWRIVQQGNSPKRLGKDAKGNTIVHPPVSLDEHVAVQRENKVRTLLLQALPEDHMPDFHHYDDARDIWMAVKARFGGNEESKKMRKTMLKQQFTEFSVTEEEGLHKGYDRFQKILSQLNQVQARPDNDDINLKFLRALPSSWSQVGLALKTRGGLDSMSFDDLYNKLRSLELDVRIGHSYGVKAAAAPTHSAFIGAASTGSKHTYSDQQSIVQSVSQTSGRSDNIMECVLHSFVAENEPDQDMIYEDFDQVDQLEMEELDLKWQMAMLSLRINRFEKKAGRKMNYNNQQPARFDRRKVRCYKCLQLGHFARECNVKTVDDKARYSAFKVTEVKTDEPKALVSVDSMVNWSDHAAENKTGEIEKVYGMMAGLHADNGSDGVANAADEFAMMGISPKVQNCPLGCDSKINDLNNMYNNLDRLYNDCYIKVQAYQNAVKTLESQKDWYHKTQIALEEKIRILTANLENTANTLSYTEQLHDQAQKEKKEWELGKCMCSSYITGTYMPAHTSIDIEETRDKSSDSLKICILGFKPHRPGPKIPPAVDIQTLQTCIWSTLGGFYIGSGNSSRHLFTADGFDLLASRNRPVVNSAEEKLDDFVQVKGGIVKFGGGDGRISGKGTIRTSKLDFENVYYGIKWETIVIPEPQQNGVVERKNKTLIEDARTMLADSKLPTMFWTEAVSTACYVLNKGSMAGIDSAGRDPAGIDSAYGVSAGSPSAGSDPAGGKHGDILNLAEMSAIICQFIVSADLHPLYVTQLKALDDPYFPKLVLRVVKSFVWRLHLAHSVLVYVDDIIFGSTNKAWCAEFELQGPDIFVCVGKPTVIVDLCWSHGDRKSTTGGCQISGHKDNFMASLRSRLLWYFFNRSEYVAELLAAMHRDSSSDQIPVFHQRIKHFARFGHHFIRDANEKELDLRTGESLFRGYGVLLDSAGRTLFLLVVIISAGCFLSAGSYGLCCWFRVHADGHTSAGGFISADGVCVPAFDIAGWLVSATSHLVSAGSIQSCWWNNVSAA